MLSAFKDAAKVAEDLADVAAQFTDVPPEVVALGKEAWCAVYHSDPVALAKVVADCTTLFETIRADGCQAQDAILTLQSDLETFLADLS